MKGVVLIFACCFFVTIIGFDLISPPEIQGHFQSVLFNEKFGRQDVENLNITGQIYVVEMSKLCDPNETKNYANKIVFYTGSTSRRIAETVESVYCIEENGALAAVVSNSELYHPGFTFRMVHGKLTRTSNIFVMTSRQSDMAKVLEAVYNNITVIIRLKADVNPWVTVWDSTEFFVVWKIIVPILNSIGVIMSSYSILLQILRVLATKKKDRSLNSVYLTLVALFLDLASFILRLAYSLLGPMFSSTNLTLEQNAYLINITVPIETSITLMSTALFVKWGAFGPVNWRRARQVEFSLLGLSAFTIGLQIALSYQQIYSRTAGTLFVALNALLITIISILTTIVFLIYGRKLIQILTKQTGKINSSNRYIKKAALWIMVGGVLQIIEISGMILAVNPNFLWSPTGFFTVYALIFTSLSLSSISSTKAFTPLGSQLKGYLTDKTKKKNSFIRAIPLAFLPASNNETAASEPSNQP